MTTLFQKFVKFFNLHNSISTGLDAYIASKNPQTVAEAESLAQRYLNRGVCGRTL
jgi:hypothetical protein